MKLIKKINNNVALCLDSKGKELVAMGKGIGFESAGTEIDLKRIERTFYDVDQEYMDFINDISPVSLKTAMMIVDRAKLVVGRDISDNLVFNLADHIDFAIERFSKGVDLDLQVYNDVEHLYEAEMEIGRYGLKIIKDNFSIELPEDEAARIALNIINAEYGTTSAVSVNINNQTIENITKVIEKFFQISIDRHSFSYSRFSTHMRYLFKRGNSDSLMKDGDRELYRTLKEKYPLTSECADQVRRYLKRAKGWQLSDEECLYLMLHINRLRNKEENS